MWIRVEVEILLTGRRRDMHFHERLDLSAFRRANITDGSMVRVKQEPARSESEDHSSSESGSTPPASTMSRGTLSACCDATNTAGPLIEVAMPMTVRISVPKEHRVPQRSSPFLERLLRNTNILDDAARKEWADDVEVRLRNIVETLEFSGECYDVERSGNGVLIFTVSPKQLTKHQIATLSAGRWPGWAEILEFVPEFTNSMVEFDAIQRWEWFRRWDIDDDEPRLKA